MKKLASLLLIPLLFFSCKSLYQIPETRDITSVEDVKFQNSQSMKILRVVNSLKYGEKIGKHFFYNGREGISKTWEDFSFFYNNDQYLVLAGNDVLKDAGCRMPDRFESIFKQDYKNDKSIPRYALAAVIKDVKYNALVKSARFSKLDMELTIQWQFFDTKLKALVYKKDITVLYYTNGKTSFQKSLFEAFKLNTKSLLAEEGVRNLLSVGESTIDITNSTIENLNSNNEDVVKVYTSSEDQSNKKINFDNLFKAVFILKRDKGHGTGFFISENGYLLTAAHVLGGFDTVNIEYAEDLVLKADLVKINYLLDIALLKVNGRGFPYLKISANPISIGENVYSLGAPLHDMLNQSVSKGIVSGLREIDNVQLIQTDAAINPGNSGGPLIDQNACVVGLVTSKFFGSEVDNVGFATSLKWALDKMKIHKKSN